MASMSSPTPKHLPGHLIEFQISKLASSGQGPRLAKFGFAGREAFDTPSYVASSSRGTVSHISQDMMRDRTHIRSMYTAAEDFVEKVPQGQIPPACAIPAEQTESPLRKFIALPKDVLLLLGPRRNPPLQCPASSTSTSISIATSTGFSKLTIGDYTAAVQKLRPDIVIGMGDVLFGQQPGIKRLDRMADRTISWMDELRSAMQDEEQGAPRSALFAPILPIEAEMQRWYLEALEDNFEQYISGFAVYNRASAAIVPNTLGHLPKFYAGHITSPHQILDAVEAGIDLLTVSFVNDSSSAGIALDFSLVSPGSDDAPAPPGKQLPLGTDLWQSNSSTDVRPIRNNCSCYTCINHHRAYLHHLLNAREMSAWVLLQIHNYHVLNELFGAIQKAIGDENFSDRKQKFQETYEQSLPIQTGQGPRMRGYQVQMMSKGGGGAKINTPAWRHSMNDRAEKLEESRSPDLELESGPLAGVLAEENEEGKAS